MTAQVGPEQREQLRLQLERVRTAKKVKKNQIDFKIKRAQLFRKLAEDGEGELSPVDIELHISDADILENDAALLELDFQEFRQLADMLEAQYKAVESGLVVPAMTLPKGTRR